MRRTVIAILSALAVAAFCSCSERKPPIEDYHQFLKTEEASISLDSDTLFEMMMYGTPAYYDDDLILFGDKRQQRIVAYRLSTDSLTTPDSLADSRFYGTVVTPVATDSLWQICHFQYADGTMARGIGNLATGKVYFPKSTLPMYGDKYLLSVSGDLPVVDGHFFTRLLSTDTALHLASIEENGAFNHWPKLAEWRIDGDSLQLVRLLVRFPDNYAATEYEDFLTKPCYNPVDSVFLLPAMDGRLWLFDRYGNSLGERRLGSQLEQPTQPFPITEGSYNNAQNWYANNNTYGRTIFDPYRNVYLRVMTIPQAADPDALEREREKTWVLVVADRDFHIKYEVRFDDQRYEWRLIMPTPEGVYIAKKKGDKYEKPSLFVFD